MKDTAKNKVKKLLGLRSASAKEAEAKALAATPAYDYDKDKADNWDDTLPCKTKFLSSLEDCDEDCNRMYTIESQKDICMEKSDKLREKLDKEREREAPNPYLKTPKTADSTSGSDTAFDFFKYLKKDTAKPIFADAAKDAVDDFKIVGTKTESAGEAIAKAISTDAEKIKGAATTAIDVVEAEYEDVSVSKVLGYIVLLTLVVLYGVALGYTTHYIWSGENIDDATGFQTFLMRSGTIVSFTLIFGGVLAVFASRA